MKPTKMSLAIIAAAGLLSLASTLRAEDPAPPAPTTPPAARRGGPRLAVDDQVKLYTEKLKLSTEQQAKLKTVLEERNKAMQEARSLTPEERRAKAPAIREEVTKKIKEILTADQFKQYEELEKRNGQVRRNAGTNAPAEGSARKKKAE